MSGPPIRLGIDLGTSAVKTVAIDRAGLVVAWAESSYPTHKDAPGAAEQDPRDWLRAVADTAGKIATQLGAGWTAELKSIGLAGQLPTLVCVGENGPLGRAIAWSDSRADAWAAERLESERRSSFYRATGMPLDGRYLAPMFQFHRPAREAGVRRILSAKDYLCFALTGRVITDPSTAAGYGLYDILKQDWSRELAAFWGIDQALLPAIGAADDAAGPLTAGAAQLLNLPEGLPVSVGAADSVAAALAMGGLDETAASIVMGSSTAVIGAARTPLLDSGARYLLTPHARAGWYGREMDLLSTGSGFRWLCGLLGWSEGTLEAYALEAAAGANGVRFAPYLAGGEQGALWNSALRGTLQGLTLTSKARDIARAFLEGVLFEIRRCLDVLEEAMPIRRITLAGRAAQSAGLVALAADVLGRAVSPFPHHSPAAIGAALLAPDGDAAIPDLESARIEPGPQAQVYERLYRDHLALFPRIAESLAGS